jgi:hypothetical protein
MALNSALIVVPGMVLTGCANHPVDCAVDCTHPDRLPGTAPYRDCKIKLSVRHKANWVY